MKFLRIAIALFIIFISTIVLSQTIYNQTDKVSIGWDPAPMTDCDGNSVEPKNALDHWEIVMVRDVTGEMFQYTASPDAVSLEILRPKSGVYTVKVKEVVASCCDGTSPCYGGWAESTDAQCATLKDGTPGSWKVRFKPSGPTGPIIIN